MEEFDDYITGMYDQGPWDIMEEFDDHIIGR
jgi:hypothetical protein